MSGQAKHQKTLEMLMWLDTPYGRNISDIVNHFGFSERTAFRYINTFREAGFVITNLNGYYRIDKERTNYKISDLLHFSDEEAFILEQAIDTIDSTNKYKDRLKQKLYSLYDFDRVAKSITTGTESKNVLALKKAMEEKKQVILRNYKSGHGSSIRDRRVEPVDFTYHYSAIWAFDTGDKQNKLFRTSRIQSVEILTTPYQFTEKHKPGKVDIFRISSFESIPLKLKMNLRACNLLVEEYPMSEKYINQINNNEYLLETEVGSLDGVGRFVMGLPGDIEIIEPTDLKKYISERIKKFADDGGR